jgi:hypothetical protein
MAAQLAVDLDHQLQAVLHQRRLVHCRPLGIDDRARVA